MREVFCEFCVQRRISSQALEGPRSVMNSDALLYEGLVLRGVEEGAGFTGVGQLDVHHVAKLLLRIVGDPDLAPVAGELDPLVVFGVFEAGRIRRHRITPPRSSRSPERLALHSV